MKYPSLNNIIIFDHISILFRTDRALPSIQIEPKSKRNTKRALRFYLTYLHFELLELCQNDDRPYNGTQFEEN